MIAGFTLILFGLFSLDDRALLGVAAILAGAALCYLRREEGLDRALAERADPACRPSPQLRLARFAVLAAASALEVLAVVLVAGTLAERQRADLWEVAGCAIGAVGFAYAGWEARRLERRLVEAGLIGALTRGVAKAAAGAAASFLALVAYLLVGAVFKAGGGGIVDSMVALAIAPLLAGLAGVFAGVVWRSRLPAGGGTRLALLSSSALASVAAAVALAGLLGVFPDARGAAPIYAHLLLFHAAVAGIGVRTLGREGGGFRHAALAMIGLPPLQGGLAIVAALVGQVADPDALVREWSVLVLFFPLYALMALAFATMLIGGGGFVLWAALGGQTAFGERLPFLTKTTA